MARPTPTPLVHSTALVLSGSLFAVGGGGGSSGIYLYQPKIKRWIKAGELPNDQAQCTCIVLGGNVVQSVDTGALNYQYQMV